MIPQLITSVLLRTYGGGVHLWDLKLKTYLSMLFVRRSCKMLITRISSTDDSVMGERL